MKKITHKEFIAQLDKLAPALDRVRSLGLSDVNRYERILGAGETREVARTLARQDKASPAVETAAFRVAGQVERNARLERVIRSVEIYRDINSGLRKITGRVVSAKGHPGAGLKVAVYKDDSFQKPLGSDRADRSGVYLVEATKSAYESYFRNAKEVVVAVMDNGSPLREVRVPVAADAPQIRQVNIALVKRDKPSDGDIPIRPGPGDRPTPLRPVPRPSGGDPSSVTLSEIPGLGPARLIKLKDASILDVNDLVKLTADRLASIIGVNKNIAAKILREAKSLLEEG